MKIRADIDNVNFDTDIDDCALVTFVVPDNHSWKHGSYAIEKWEDQPEPTNRMAVELAAKILWIRDYPNGGSIYKTFEQTNEDDKRIYREEVESLLALSATEKPEK